MKYISQREHGQSIVLITLLLMGLIAMLGLIIDGGNAYVKRRNMQNAADAAALAGGRQLALANGAGDNSDAARILVKNAINNYTTANGGTTSANNLYAFFVDQSNISKGRIGENGGIPDGTTGVSVTISTQFPTYFLGVVNISTGDVGAHALVQTGYPSSVQVLFPITVPYSNLLTTSPHDYVHCQFNLEVNPNCLIWGDKTANQSGSASSSGWTSYDICSMSDQTLVGLLNGTLEIGNISDGSTICTGTGAKASMASYLAPWVGKDVVAPIFDDTNGVSGSGLTYHVLAFGVFKFTGFYLSASGTAGDISCGGENNKFLCGKFLRWAQPGDIIITKKCSYSFCGFQMWQ